MAKALEGIIKQISKGLSIGLFSIMSFLPMSQATYAEPQFIDPEKIREEKQALEESLNAVALCFNDDKENKSTVVIKKKDEERTIDVDETIARCKFSPDGRVIALLGGTHPFQKGSGLYIIHLGQEEVKQADDVNCFEWASDSQRIFFSRQDALYVADTKNRNITKLTTGSKYKMNLYPSRTNRDYVVIRGDKEENEGKVPYLFIVDIQGKKVLPIDRTDTNGGVCCTLDDKVIYHKFIYDSVTTRAVDKGIYLYDIDKGTSSRVELVNKTGNCRAMKEMAVSKHGEIAYTYCASDNSGLLWLSKIPYAVSTRLLPKSIELPNGEVIDSINNIKWGKTSRYLFFQAEDTLYSFDTQTESVRALIKIGSASTYDVDAG